VSWLVRDATPDDAAACAAIYAHYVTATPISFEERPPTLEEMTGRIAKAQARHAFLVLADEQAPDVVVGYAYAGPFASRPAYRWSTEASVYVEKDLRGRGAGRALYEVLVPRLVALGYRRLLAGITVPNDASVGLHRAFGFEPVGTHRRIGWKLGAWRDVLWLARDLADDEVDPPIEPGSSVPAPA
jgi:phosphinothricin acetyltransferase